MNDLDLLETLPQPVAPLDDTAKDRIRNQMQIRATRRTHRLGRPSRKAAAICAVLVVGGAASVAAAVVHPWSPSQPIAIPPGEQQPGMFSPKISDPELYLTTPDQIESAVAEFASSIRLPQGGSFQPWTQHVADSPSLGLPAGGYTRVEVVQYMVNASTCQWTQQWLDAVSGGRQAQAAQAERVLSDMNDWATASGYQAMSNVLTAVNGNDMAAANTFENSQCAYTGSWGANPTDQDARARHTLDPAIHAAQQFLTQAGDPQSFTWKIANNLDADVIWASGDTTPSPFPGVVFIAQPATPGITLVSISESGRQFCAVVSPSGVTRGTTTNDIQTAVWTADGLEPRVPGPVACSPNT